MVPGSSKNENLVPVPLEEDDEVEWLLLLVGFTAKRGGRSLLLIITVLFVLDHGDAKLQVTVPPPFLFVDGTKAEHVVPVDIAARARKIIHIIIW